MNQRSLRVLQHGGINALSFTEVHGVIVNVQIGIRWRLSVLALLRIVAFLSARWFQFIDENIQVLEIVLHWHQFIAFFRRLLIDRLLPDVGEVVVGSSLPLLRLLLILLALSAVRVQLVLARLLLVLIVGTHIFRVRLIFKRKFAK